MRTTSTARAARAMYVVLAATTIALGLASRRFAPALPDAVGLYAGDALWAATAYFAAAAVWPRAPVARLAAGVLAFSVAIELSQLYHAPWIDALRATRPGALVLGFGFLWTDLAAYTVGVALAALADAMVSPQSRGRSLRSPLGRNIV